MKKQYFITGTIIIILIIGIFVYINNQDNTEHERTVKIGYTLWQGHLAQWVAYEQDFFKEEGINVELVDLGANYQEAIDGVIGGRIDIGTGIFAQTMNIEARNPGLIYTFHLLGETKDQEGVTNAILTLRESKINTLKDLENKIIGVSTKVEMLQLKPILSEQGVNNVEMKELDEKIILTVLASKKIDAIFVVKGNLIQNALKNLDAKLVEINVRAKYLGSPFWRTGNIVLVKFVEENSKEMKAYMRAIDRAIGLIEEDEERKVIAPVLLKYMPKSFSEETVKSVGIDKFAKSTEFIDINRIQNTANTFVKAGVLEEQIDVNRFYLSYHEIKNKY